MVNEMSYISAKEAAANWSISERRVQVLCEQGRIAGVFRLGDVWAIPADAAKPPDARRRENRRESKKADVVKEDTQWKMQ